MSGRTAPTGRPRSDSPSAAEGRKEKLEDRGRKSRIHRKGHRNRPLNTRKQQDNKTRSKVRARVEPVFGALTNDTGGTLVRSIGIAPPRRGSG